MWLATLAARVLRTEAGGGLGSPAWLFRPHVQVHLELAAAGFDPKVAVLVANGSASPGARSQIA